MININENFGIKSPKNQIRLFGYEYYFNSFAELYHKNKLPNTILLSGAKGSGKATFAYHFINYLLSFNENDKYLIDNFSINPDNKSYKNLCNYTHTNFLLLDNDKFGEKIKIEKVRNALKFLNKSTYLSSVKVILLDNAENLNLHSSNALLKVLEEADNKTFFFIIHNNNYKILNTIKSRCIEFKFFFTISQKKKILENIIYQYTDDFDINKVDDFFYFDSPGNILKYLLILKDSNVNFSKDKLSCIMYLIDEYKKNQDSQLLMFISMMIELFYNELSTINNKNLNLYFLNKFKLLRKIKDTEKFNLDKKNLFIFLQDTLKNESK